MEQPGVISIIISFLLFLSAGIAAFILRKLTLIGAFTGAAVATCIFVGGGLTGVVMLGVFFVGGTIATSYKSKEKYRLGVAHADEQRRDNGQVLANGGVAAIAGLCAVIFPNFQWGAELVMAAALASATSDTFSSEFGDLYGKNFYNVLTLKKDKRGLNGVVSLEGTLFGIFGSALIALIYITNEFSYEAFLSVSIAGIAGNLADSYLGALLERREILSNNQVNFLNTLIAGGIGYGIYQLF